MRIKLPNLFQTWLDGLSPRDRKTLMIGVAFILVYLPGFAGLKVIKGLEVTRREHLQHLTDLDTLKSRFQTYETKLLEIERLRKSTGIQVGELNRANVVGMASAALQETAKNSSLVLGPIRETVGGSQGGVISTMQLEATGPIASILSFLDGLRSSGYPLVVEDVRIDPAQGKPGQLKLNLGLTVLDFNSWKTSTRGRRA